MEKGSLLHHQEKTLVTVGGIVLLIFFLLPPAAAQQQAQGYHWYTFSNVHRAPSVIPKFPGWPAADAPQPPPA